MLRSGLAALLASASLGAQTFVVDAANGPGTNFTDIAAAVAAVPDGARLLVRSGSYGAFALDGKGMTILADAGTIGLGVMVTGLISVRNTSATQPVTIRVTRAQGLLLRNCAGSAVLLGIALEPAYDPFGRILGSGLVADGCAQLTLKQVSTRFPLFGDGNLVTLASCTAALIGCDLHGISERLIPRPGLPAQVFASEALSLANSTVAITGGRIAGGTGFSYSSGSAIHLTGGDLRILDGTLAGGTFGSSPAGLAIAGSGPVRIDPATVVATGTSPPFGTGLTPVFLRMPSLSSTDSAPPGSLAALLADPVGDAAILLVGLQGPPLTVPGIRDAFWLAPNAFLFAASGVAPLSAALVVPAIPQLRGFVLGWQGVTMDAAGMLQASNPGLGLVQ